MAVRSTWGRAGALALFLAGAAPAGARAGDLKGTVSFAGTAPRAAALAVTRDQGACGGALEDESIVVAGGKLANAVVTVRGVAAVPEQKAVVLDQRRCRYVPHVVAAPRGSSLDIVNSDPLLHNIHGYAGSATAFNVALPMKDQRVTRKLDKVGPVRVKCDVHPWMSAWVVVTDGPTAVSGADGSYVIRGLPPGTYTVNAWHEKLGDRSAQVTVGASGDARVDFAY